MKRLMVALLAVLSLVLSGCSGLASSSPVQPGLAVDADVPPGLDYVPPVPYAGADPSAILRGFILSGAVADGNYEVGRAYLTETAGRAWSPDGDVLVFSADVPVKVTAISANTWRAEVVALQTISSEGRMVELPPGTKRSFDVKMAKVKGEWRISALPNGFGRWIRGLDLDRLFVSYSVNYVSATDGTLVPDQRWFPRDHVATRLAIAQLGTVPAYLGKAVRTNLPLDAGLNVASVPILDGVATVDLTASAFSSGVNVRRGIWAQFAATLSQLPTVGSVEVLYEGAPLEYPGRPDSGVTLADLGLAETERTVTAAPIVRSGEKVTALSRDQLVSAAIPVPAQLPALTYNDVDTGFTSIALSADGAEVAVVEGRGTRLSRWREGTLFQINLAANRLSMPAYDRRNYLWIGGEGTGSSRGQHLWVVSPTQPAAGAKASPVTAPWLAGRRVISLDVSADGQRVAIISTDAQGGVEVDVSGVIRNSEGLPVGLAEPLALVTNLSEARDLTWVDSVTIAVLGRETANEAIRPYLVDLGGQVTRLSATPGATTISSLTGERDIVVATEDDIRIRTGPGWTTLTSGTDFAVAGG